MPEAPAGQQQARHRFARGHRLRDVRQGQREAPRLPQLRQLLPHQRRIGLIEGRSLQQLLQEVSRQIGLQFADDMRLGVEIERRRTRDHLQRGRQFEAELLQSIRIVGPVQLQRQSRAGS